MFTSAISKIWLVGLALFALVPLLIANRSKIVNTPSSETPVLESSVIPKTDPSGKVIADKRDPAAAESPLATGN